CRHGRRRGHRVDLGALPQSGVGDSGAISAAAGQAIEAQADRDQTEVAAGFVACSKTNPGQLEASHQAKQNFRTPPTGRAWEFCLISKCWQRFAGRNCVPIRESLLRRRPEITASLRLSGGRALSTVMAGLVPATPSEIKADFAGII